jgi:hypothetical protein
LGACTVSLAAAEAQEMPPHPSFWNIGRAGTEFKRCVEKAALRFWLAFGPTV